MRRSLKLVVLIVVWSTAARAGGQPATTPTTVPSLDEQVRVLKVGGEPIVASELKCWPTLPDRRNAAKLVWSLKDRMRRPTTEGGGWGQALSKRGIEDYRPSFTNEEIEEIRKALAPQQDALAQLDRIPTLDGFDWGDSPPSPFAVTREGFPEHAFWGTCRHQLFLDGLLAIQERNLPRLWNRVEVLRQLGDGMSTYPGEHDLGPLWPYLHQLSARLAIEAASADAVSPDTRERMRKLIAFWLDERHMLEGAIRHYQRERVGIIDTYAQLNSGSLDAGRLAKWGHDVHALQEKRIGVPMWPTVVAFYTAIIQAHRDAGAISRDGTLKTISAAHEHFAQRGFVPMYVTSQLGPGIHGWNATLRAVRGAQKLAATALAVHLYRIDHDGGFPAKLEDLVPKYLPAVPIDPLDLRSLPIRYQPDAEGGPALWTSGQDGEDHGGKERPKGVSRLDRRVEQDDVVRFIVSRNATTAPARWPLRTSGR